MSDKQIRQCFVRQSSFTDLMADLTAEQQETCNKLRLHLLSLPTSLNEVIWRQQRLITYGAMPDDSNAAATDNFAYIYVEKEVQLGFYYASDLADPVGLLDTRGRLIIDARDELQCTAVMELLLAALVQRNLC